MVNLTLSVSDTPNSKLATFANILCLHILGTYFLKRFVRIYQENLDHNRHFHAPEDAKKEERCKSGVGKSSLNSTLGPSYPH